MFWCSSQLISPVVFLCFFPPINSKWFTIHWNQVWKRKGKPPRNYECTKVYRLSWYRFIDTIEPFFLWFIIIFPYFPLFLFSSFSLFSHPLEKKRIWKEWVFLFCSIDSVVCSLFSISVGGEPFITNCGSSASHLLWKPPRKRLDSMSLPVAFHFCCVDVHSLRDYPAPCDRHIGLRQIHKRRFLHRFPSLILLTHLYLSYFSLVIFITFLLLPFLC